MTKNEQKSLRRLIKLLNQAANIADELEIVLGNGALAGSLIGSMASEFELKLKALNPRES